MNNIQIKKYDTASSDIKSIEKICRDFEFFNSYREFFTDDYYTVYGAWDEDQMVAVLVFSRHSFVLYGDFLWVDKKYRNKGIGKDLMSFFEKHGKEKGFRAIIGETLSTNQQGRRFYEGLGAEKYGEFDNLYGEGTELMIMYRKKFPENMEINK